MAVTREGEPLVARRAGRQALGQPRVPIFTQRTKLVVNATVFRCNMSRPWGTENDSRDTHAHNLSTFSRIIWRWIEITCRESCIWFSLRLIGPHPVHMQTLTRSFVFLPQRSRASVRTIYLRSGYVSTNLNRRMLQDNSKTRPASAVEDLAQPLAEKRPRLEVLNETIEDGVPETIPAADESAGISENPSERTKAKPSRQQKRRKEKLPVPGTSEDVIFNEVVALLGKSVVDEAFEKGTERNSPFEFREIVELTVSSISPSGTSLSCLTFVQILWGAALRLLHIRSSDVANYAQTLSEGHSLSCSDDAQLVP